MEPSGRKVGAVLLAAGGSRRMGAVNKLRLPVDGEPLVRVCARALLAAGLAPVVVVLGAGADAVAAALADLDVAPVRNPRHAEGMGTSLAAGVAALPEGLGAVLVALGDMPAVRPDTFRALLAAEGGIVVPVYRGRRGHPVRFRLPAYRAELLALDGDCGARAMLAAHPEDVVRVPVDDPGVLLDLDTPEEYERWQSRRVRSPQNLC